MNDLGIYNRILTQAEINSMSTLANSDTLVDTSALKVRFNFDAPNTPIAGKLLVPAYGILQSSPRLGAGAVWTATTNAFTPQTFTPNPAKPTMFYRTAMTTNLPIFSKHHAAGAHVPTVFILSRSPPQLLPLLWVLFSVCVFYRILELGMLHLQRVGN